MIGELSKHEACKVYDLHWDTLKKILAHELPPGYRKRQEREKPILGPFIPLIHEIIEADKKTPKKQKHTSKRIFERLCEKGYQGSASGRLDHQTYYKSILVDQDHLGLVALDRVLRAWLTPQLFCNYQKNSRDLWECQNPGCKDVFKRLESISYPDAPPVRECPAAPEIISAATEAGGRIDLLDAAGNLAEDAMHYARSLAQWAWAGFPVRTAEETAIRYEICSGEQTATCDKFEGGKCTICGCPVRRKNAACSSKTRPL